MPGQHGLAFDGESFVQCTYCHEYEMNVPAREADYWNCPNCVNGDQEISVHLQCPRCKAYATRYRFDPKDLKMLRCVMCSHLWNNKND